MATAKARPSRKQQATSFGGFYVKAGSAAALSLMGYDILSNAAENRRRVGVRKVMEKKEIGKIMLYFSFSPNFFSSSSLANKRKNSIHIR